MAVIPIYTNKDGETIHYRSSETGEGFEFWNVENDRPIYQEDEAPHYAISQQGYEVVAKHFSSYIGRLQLTD